MDTQNVDDDYILNYSLDNHLKNIELGKLGEKKATDPAIQNQLHSVLSVFEKMKPEQFLLYGVNLYYRFKVTENAEMHAKESDIKPPKTEERVAIGLGLQHRFSGKEYQDTPEASFILNTLGEIVDHTKEPKDCFLNLMVLTARLLHDERGAQWLVSPRSRIAVGDGEVAEFMPNVWMILQDNILKFLNPPQLAELYLAPISPKNPGEVLRRSITKGASYKGTILKEIQRRTGEQSKGSSMSDTQARNALKSLIHDYKLEMHKAKSQPKT